MPEIAEIHRFCKLINSLSNETFRLVETSTHPKFASFNTLLTTGQFSTFSLTADVRGKELCLHMKPLEGGETLDLTWNFGLVGRFIVSPAASFAPPGAQVSFLSDSIRLSYVDVQKMGKFREGSFDFKTRSADPILQHTEFCQNICDSLHRAPFKKELGTVLLNQRFFNGVGNYIRAEVVHRAGVDPRTPADEFFRDLATLLPTYSPSSISPSSPKPLLILFLCAAIPCEVLERDLNKYGSKEEVAQFNQWLRVYSKGDILLLGGRKFYWKQGATEPDLPSLSGTAYPEWATSGAPVLASAPASSSSGGSFGSATPTSYSGGGDGRGAAGTVAGAVGYHRGKAEVDSLADAFASLRIFNLPPEPSPPSLSWEESHAPNFPYQLSKIKEHLLRNTTSKKGSSLPLSFAGKALLLLTTMELEGLIGSQEKERLKDQMLLFHTPLVEAIQSFLKTYDLAELSRSLHELSSQSPPAPRSVAPSASYSSFSPSSPSYKPSSVTSVSSFSPAPMTVGSAYSPFGSGGGGEGFSPSSSSSSNVGPYGLTDSSWVDLLKGEFEAPYFKQIESYVARERASHPGAIYPPDSEVLSMLNACSVDDVKVVILGQDPYFNPGQAHGLCFSVRKGVPVPPSLRRIYKVLESTIPGFKIPQHGCLEEWAQRGVLLLNATLTVEHKKPNSHAKCGWQTFTDNLIRKLNAKSSGLVYLLWGKFAQKKGSDVTASGTHKVLRTGHPSPMAGAAFNTCDHFRKCNDLLKELGKEPIDWRISQ